ncbi:MAG: hypothetical protein ACRCWB_03120 [Enterovibrio sp.]
MTAFIDNTWQMKPNVALANNRLKGAAVVTIAVFDFGGNALPTF